MKSNTTIPNNKKIILEWLRNRWRGITPGELNQLAAQRCNLTKRKARQLVTELVKEGELAYREQHGHTIIEPSFNKAVRLSPHIIVAPPGIPVELQMEDRLVRLIHGVSFGSGQHPTTRLSIGAIDYLFDHGLLPAKNALLDIGTGSGILGLAGLVCGVRKGEGIDIDPCAVYEATENTALNQMTGRFEVHKRPLETIPPAFDLILANLRFPTLTTLYPQIIRLASSQCSLVVSGIHTDEIKKIKQCYNEKFRPVWEADEKDWAALAFVRGDNALAEKELEKEAPSLRSLENGIFS